MQQHCSFKSLICLLFCYILYIYPADSYAAETVNWNQLEGSNYLQEQLNCQSIIADFYWGNRLWPNSNPNEKPSRASVISKQEIKQQIQQNLLMERLLKKEFNISLTHVEMERELKRITASTKMPKKLSHLFEVLDQNVNAVIECLVRPQVVNEKIRLAYNNSITLHLPTRKLAALELDEFINTGNTPVNSQDIKYTLEGESNNSDDLADVHVVELTNEQLSKRLMEVQEFKFLNKVKERPGGFYFDTLLDQQTSSLTVKRSFWPKVSFDDWYKSQNHDLLAIHPKTIPLTITSLPNISSIFKSNTKQQKDVFADSWEVEYLPFARYNHMAVWTGTEMIVWGGPDNTDTGGRYNPITDMWLSMPGLNGAYIDANTRPWQGVWTGTDVYFWAGGQNGGRYNPGTDSWVDMSIDLPVYVRESPHVHWTGDLLIVWGGGKFSNYTNQGAIYDPDTDSWTEMSVVGAPSDRNGMTSVWTGSAMLLWGGTQDNNGWRYDVNTDSWSDISSVDAPEARAHHTATWVGDGMVVWGGTDFGQNGGYLTEGAHYNPDTDTWTDMGMNGVPEGRSYHTAVYTGNELLIWGGDVNGVKLNSVGIYDLNTAQWTINTDNQAPIGRSAHSAIWTGTEMIVWGGVKESGVKLSSGGRFNLNAQVWQATTDHADFYSYRRSASSVWTGNELIYWGGLSLSNEFNTGVKFTPLTNHWQAVTTVGAPDRRYGHTAVWTGTEMIIWGGHDGTFAYFGTGGRYNPSTGSWTDTLCCTSAVARGRTSHTAVWTGSEMIVWGGRYRDDQGNSYNLSTGSRYNPSLDSWNPTDDSIFPYGRIYHSAVWTGSRMLIWGGKEWLDYVNTGYIYNPFNDTWQTMSDTDAPDGRFKHSTVWTGVEMIVWGGQDEVNETEWFDTGGKYNPNLNTWEATSLTGPPLGRSGHSAVWSGQDMIIWGGADSNSGGVYNPSQDTWTPTTLYNAPAARSNHIATWIDNLMIIWGGNNDSGAYTGFYQPYNADLIFKNGFD